MAKTFPLEAANIAFKVGISFLRARTKSASEEKGRIVAAKNAEIKSANSAI